MVLTADRDAAKPIEAEGRELETPGELAEEPREG